MNGGTEKPPWYLSALLLGLVYIPLRLYGSFQNWRLWLSQEGRMAWGELIPGALLLKSLPLHVEWRVAGLTAVLRALGWEGEKWGSQFLAKGI